jgi:hypothetical protein
MLTEPLVSEGVLGRQLLPAISPESENINRAVLVTVNDVLRLKVKTPPDGLAKAVHVLIFLEGPELATASIAYFRDLRNSPAFKLVSAERQDVFSQ